MQRPRADRWGQPDFEGYISVSDGFPEEDETDVEEQPEPTLVQTPPDNSCRHIVEAIAAPPPPPPPELAELEEFQELQDENAEGYAEEYSTEKCVEVGPEATSQTLSQHCNEIRPLVFQRMLLDLAAEYNRVLAKLQDTSGTMTLAEFEHVLSSKEVRAYLDALGIEVDKAKGLFQLLDLDMSGEISIDEFTFGCNRLKGGAKSIDLATLMMHSRRMADQWHRFFTWTESQFKRLHEFESRVEERLAWYASALTPAGDH